VGRMNRLVISPELSYVIGVRFGDACSNVNPSKGNYALELAVTDLDFAKEFNRCVTFALGKPKGYSIFKVKGRDPRYKTLYKIVAYSKRLLELFNDGWEEVVEKYPCCFIRGFADSEGSPICKTDRQAPNILIENTDLKLLEYVRGLLSKLGIESAVFHTNKKGDRKTFVFKKDCYRLVIRRFDSVVKYAEMIGFSIERKQKRLEELIKNKGFNSSRRTTTRKTSPRTILQNTSNKGET